jgi:hypothetical protein
LDDLFKLFSINALSLVVAENHSLGHLLVLGVGLLLMEFLNAVAVDLEPLLITEFALSEVFITRNYRVEVENILVWGFEVTKQVVNVHVACWLVGATLGHMCLTS